jgi:hypothetical protein
MSAATIDRPPTPPRFRAGFGRRLRVRLSNGFSWAHEFEANDPISLRDGCAEAHFEHQHTHAETVASRFPEYQTRNRDSVRRAARLESLYLYVWHRRQWLNANYGTNGERLLTVRAPGAATNGESWSDADWFDAWTRCERCKSAAEMLDRFCDGIGDFIADELL